MSQPVLQVVIGSTRPGRVGPAIAQWFVNVANQHGGFDVELVDLADYALPIYDEPNHPILQQYTKEHTKRWSSTITRADAFVFVIPEYNHSFNAAIKNALDFLYHEWHYKPTGLLSYGGAAMGTRAAQALKPVLAQLKLPHAGDITVPMVTAPVKDGVFAGNDIIQAAATAVLDELTILTPTSMERRERAKSHV